MAIGKLEEELLKDFWEKHQELLMQMFPIIADLEEDEDKAEMLKEFSNKMTENFKRYDNLDNYINNELGNRTDENIKRLRLLMDKIESFFEDKIEITYAPSRINIKNPNSKKRGKVFVYIYVMKNKIRLDIMFPQIGIELLSKDDIINNKENYLNILEEAFESLEN